MMIKENNVDSTFLQIMKDNSLGGLEDIKTIKNIKINIVITQIIGVINIVLPLLLFIIYLSIFLIFVISLTVKTKLSLKIPLNIKGLNCNFNIVLISSSAFLLNIFDSNISTF